jgi:hypothetical protein
MEPKDYLEQEQRTLDRLDAADPTAKDLAAGEFDVRELPPEPTEVCK